MALLSSWPCFQLLRRILFCFSLSSLSTQTALPDKHFLGSTCILMILMSFISSLGCFCCCFQYLCCCCCDFLELSGVAIAEDFQLDILSLYFVWGLTGICAAFCHREISSGTFTSVFHLCLCWNWLSQVQGWHCVEPHLYSFWVVLVSEGFFYRSCLLVANI